MYYGYVVNEYSNEFFGIEQQTSENVRQIAGLIASTKH